MNNFFKNKKFLIGVIFLLYLTSCRKFVEIDPPKTSLVKKTVFTNDATATAAIIDVYAKMIFSGYANGTFSGISYNAGLAADELDLFATRSADILYANNNLTPSEGTLNSNFWGNMYQQIFRANAILEGLDNSVGLSNVVKTRIEGEAKFMRAFAYFYLVNLFGDVPLVLSTDYRINSTMPRTPSLEVYTQIIRDLKDAQNTLSEDYLSANGAVSVERKRINKFAATAMLSRVFLYQKDWQNAEIEATKVIAKTSLYGPTPLGEMFLKNSIEAIWQLAKDNGNTNDVLTFTPVNGTLKPAFYASFDNSDLRKSNWVIVKTLGANTYYQPFKYKAEVATPITEYSMVLRLGEQYLIRAEARAHLGKITGPSSSEADLNYIRNRAGISNATASTETAILSAIEKERQFELFTEWGHRWFDLKRTNRADAVLGALKGNWQSSDQLWPIPQQEIRNNPSITNHQNPGYE